MDDDTEVIAIFLDESAEADDVGEIDFAATSCLLRDASGSVSIKPMRATDNLRFDHAGSGIFRRGTPIVDPLSGDVIGYELEEDENIRVCVG